MATTNSLRLKSSSFPVRKQFPPPHFNNNNNFLLLKPAANSTISFSQSHSSTTFSCISSSLAASSTSTTSTTFDLLHHHLLSQNFKQADEETRRLLIALAGEPAVKRGYVFFSETKSIPDSDLIAIDELWRKHSDNRFGYSVQKQIWGKAKKDFTTFFIKVGWMKKLETEVEQYNYRAFPNEFMWELTDETPLGHLPLTNALRGTQLLTSIFTHSAFQSTATADEEQDDKIEVGEVVKPGFSALNKNKRVFESDYSF